MKKSQKGNALHIRHYSEKICTIFTLFVSTFYLLTIPLSDYTSIVNWKYHTFLIAYIGLIVVMAEQKVIGNDIIGKNLRSFDIFSSSISIYFLFTCISGIFSKYPGTFWGNARCEGILTIGIYVISTLLLAKYFRPQRLILISFGTAITLHCLVGIFQLCGLNPFSLYPDGLNYYDAGTYYAGQYWSTIGNTNLCAALLSTAAGAFSAAAIRASRRTDWLALIPLCLSVFSIIELDSEAGMVALAGGLVLMPVFVVTAGNHIKNLLFTYCAISATFTISSAVHFYDGGAVIRLSILTLAGSIAAIILSICGLLLGRLSIIRCIKTSTLRKAMVVTAITIICTALLLLYSYSGFPDGFLLQAHNLLHGVWDDSYGSNRIYIWRQVWALICESPILGGGPDTLGLRGLAGFSRYNEATGTIVTGSIDAAHNEYLNIFVNQGIFALAAYLSAIFISTIRWWKNIEDHAKAIAGAAALFYLIQACFGISMCITAPYLWIALAVLNKKTERNEKNETCKETHRVKLGPSPNLHDAADHRIGRQ